MGKILIWKGLMILNKVVVGVVLNERVFRLSSNSGILTDAVVSAANSGQGKEFPLFTRVGGSSDVTNYQVGFFTEDMKNVLHIDTAQVVYTRSSSSPGVGSLGVGKVIEEFGALWKILDKVMKFPAVRRIGVVGEFLLFGEGENSSDKLMSGLVKLPVASGSHSSRFNLHFEERRVLSSHGDFNPETADFWNCIYSIYNSERDMDFKLSGRANANIDVQKYYNPAKLNPLRELKSVHEEFSGKRRLLKERLETLGLVNE